MLLARIIVFIMLSCLSLLAASSQNSGSYKELFEKLKQGQVIAIMRHALAPGTGDPNNFTLGDCTTQRNLSVIGRQQASKIGDAFRQHDIASARVYSSQWCRCIDTATEMKLGEVSELAAINSFFQFYDKEAEQMQQLNNWLQAQNNDQPTILVTHQVNITALTGVFPQSGEVVFVSIEPSGAVVVEGSIVF